LATSPDSLLYLRSTQKDDNRSLVAFSVATQMAVGMFTSAAVAVMTSAETSSLRGNDTALPMLIATSASLFLLGLLFSIAHVDHPRLFLTMARNWRSSWLSREAIFAAVFLILLLMFFLVHQPKYLPEWRYSCSSCSHSYLQSQPQARLTWFDAYLTLSIVVGLAFVGVQAMIYKLQSSLSWDHPHTVISFFATAVATGPPAVAMLLAVETWLGDIYLHTLWAPLPWLVKSAAAILFVIPLQLLIEVTYLARLKELGEEAGASYDVQTRKLKNFLLARIALAAIILGLSVATLVFRADLWPPYAAGASTVVIFFGALGEELLGRYLFYYGVVPAKPSARYAEFFLGS